MQIVAPIQLAFTSRVRLSSIGSFESSEREILIGGVSKNSELSSPSLLLPWRSLCITQLVTYWLEIFSYWLFQLALDSNKSKGGISYLHMAHLFSFYRRLTWPQRHAKSNQGRVGQVHSNLDATRRLGELNQSSSSLLQLRFLPHFLLASRLAVNSTANYILTWEVIAAFCIEFHNNHASLQ